MPNSGFLRGGSCGAGNRRDSLYDATGKEAKGADGEDADNKCFHMYMLVCLLLVYVGCVFLAFKPSYHDHFSSVVVVVVVVFFSSIASGATWALRTTTLVAVNNLPCLV